jgi:hypothetical protein
MNVLFNEPVKYHGVMAVIGTRNKKKTKQDEYDIINSLSSKSAFFNRSPVFITMTKMTIKNRTESHSERTTKKGRYSVTKKERFFPFFYQQKVK